ncbi:uncharacterized protein EV420DRAFT_1507057 [Desarmillaria tabescens]|uniref:Uncharacterized protein n=1 Tax=Armillaria tabescens TaxID=1929756 RepID=A0AA39NK18_ARMTA|nr:uncharacterized protein EV420DRAFT_1507057 [Desarmillaria tabescens]KAK0467073.1 hypothetical protein EV420DRAFT_1507057 [Desarmillaria tabescens]
MFKAREAQRRFVNTVRVPSCTRKERALVRERHRTSGGTSPKTLADEFGISTTAISNYIRNASNDNVAWDQEYLDGSRPDFFGLDYGVKGKSGTIPQFFSCLDKSVTKDLFDQTYVVAGLSASSATVKIPSTTDVPEKSTTTKRVPSQVGAEPDASSDASSSGSTPESQDSTSSTPSSNDPDPSASSDSNIPPAISRKRPRSHSAVSLHIPPAISRKKPHLDAWEPKTDVQNTVDSGQITLSAVETSTPTVVPSTSTSKPISAPVGPVTRRIAGRRGPLVIKSRAVPHLPTHKLKPAQPNAASNGVGSLPIKGKEVPTKSILTNKDSGHPTVDGFLRSLNKLHVKAQFDKCGIRTHQDLLEVSKQISETPQNREDLRKTFIEQGMSIADWFTIVAGVQKYADNSN